MNQEPCLNAFTACAIQKAISKSHPGRSRKDQPLERVTKIRAWLTILTCKYKADIISCSLPLKSLTWNVLYRKTRQSYAYVI